MIQLLTIDNEIIYEIEKSELFQDYRSVLIEAIAYNIDLSNLYVNSECIDNVVWAGVNLKNAKFTNCSMKNNKFIDCNYHGVNFNACDLERLKIKNSTLRDFHIDNCNLSFLSIRQSYVINNFTIGCNCKSSLFFETEINNTRFDSCDLSKATFNKCHLSFVSFIHNTFSKEWIKDTSFLYCSFVECNLNYVDDISVLFLWQVNVLDIQFKNNEKFTEIINPNSRVLYAIDSDVVWWKPAVYSEENPCIYRSTLEEFQYEVKNRFPTTAVFPEMDDFEIENELLNVCAYLETWQNKK